MAEHTSNMNLLFYDFNGFQQKEENNGRAMTSTGTNFYKKFGDRLPTRDNKSRRQKTRDSVSQSRAMRVEGFFGEKEKKEVKHKASPSLKRRNRNMTAESKQVEENEEKRRNDGSVERNTSLERKKKKKQGSSPVGGYIGSFSLGVQKRNEEKTTPEVRKRSKVATEESGGEKGKGDLSLNLKISKRDEEMSEISEEDISPRVLSSAERKE